MKLSPTMHKAVDLANEGGGRLVYMLGGFWVKPGTPTDKAWPVGFRPIGDYVTLSTVRALVKRGVFAETKRHPRYNYLVEVRVQQSVNWDSGIRKERD